MNNKDMPAYLLPITSTMDGYTGSSANEREHGLTKIEEFTMAALQGLCANPDLTHTPAVDLGYKAVVYAEAALAELERRG